MDIFACLYSSTQSLSQSCRKSPAPIARSIPTACSTIPFPMSRTIRCMVSMSVLPILLLNSFAVSNERPLAGPLWILLWEFTQLGGIETKAKKRLHLFPFCYKIHVALLAGLIDKWQAMKLEIAVSCRCGHRRVTSTEQVWLKKQDDRFDLMTQRMPQACAQRRSDKRTVDWAL